MEKILNLPWWGITSILLGMYAFFNLLFGLGLYFSPNVGMAGLGAYILVPLGLIGLLIAFGLMKRSVVVLTLISIPVLIMIITNLQLIIFRLTTNGVLKALSDINLYGNIIYLLIFLSPTMIWIQLIERRIHRR